jgi:Lar family restriction alleviation protein
MTHEPDLKPCPFCGGTNTEIDGKFTDNGSAFWVCCNDCNGRGPALYKKGDMKIPAMESWNQRYDQWQPIETAPKDGNPFLAFCDMDGAKFQTVLTWEEVGAKYPWRDWNGVGIHNEVPTHWMPLPSAPKTDVPS